MATPSIFKGDIAFKVKTDNVSNPPTDAELDAAYPDTRTGHFFILDDAEGGTAVYLIAKTSAGWMIWTGTAAA